MHPVHRNTFGQPAVQRRSHFVPSPAIGSRLAALGTSCQITVCAGFLLITSLAAWGQPVPHLAYVYPAGGRVGDTLQITVGGQSLMTVSNAFITGTGISAAVVDRNRPMNQKEFTGLRDRLKELQEKLQGSRRGNAGTNTWTDADAREREEIRAKILRAPPNRAANPAMTETVTIKVSIANDAPPGEREIRLATPNALSNPLRFCVGTFPEVSRAPAKPANPDLDKFLERLGGPPAPTGTPKHEAKIVLPTTVNGQIMPGGVDGYRFFARHGQHLVMAASARALIPYLADAVPGWFEPVLTLYDSKGRELACEERFRFKPDPVLHFEVPQDGEYTLTIHDSIYRGREDFVYRLTVGELPFVTDIFPLGGPAGEKTLIHLSGWNLPENEISIDNRAALPGIVALTGNFFNSVPFAVDDLPEELAGSGNHLRETGQTVQLPVIINGRIGQPGEREVFKFRGHIGEKVVAEVVARRLDSPLDSFLQLTDGTGKQLAFNDDFEDKGSSLNTHQADSYLTAILPADGNYFVQLSDIQGQAGPEFAYRLRISDSRPDFALRLVPASLSVRSGMSASLTAYALRRDGFTNAIQLRLAHAPEGFSLSGAEIGANQDKVQFTLRPPPHPTETPIAIAIEGRTEFGNEIMTRPAVPAEDLMQAFIYRHLVPSQELAVMVSGPERRFLSGAFRLISAMPVKISPGGTAHVQVSSPGGNSSARFDVELNNPPEGIALKEVSAVPGGWDLLFACDAGKAKPGLAGNLICNILPKNGGLANSQKKTGTQIQRPGATATLPAMPFIVLSR
jgi:hypothetical protein